jgi:hypothetical protein
VASTPAKKCVAMSPSSTRARFFVQVVASHTASSNCTPTNQRNNMLYSSCSTSCRSLRPEDSTCSTSARSRRAGAIEGRPRAGYRVVKCGARSTSTGSTSRRNDRIG